ncbi:MAG: hypothetical protein ACJAWM_001682 [Sulfitobacter sp.]|jgi:hypothetical protein
MSIQPVIGVVREMGQSLIPAWPAAPAIAALSRIVVNA